MTPQRFSLLMKCLHYVDNSSLAACNSAAEKSFWKIKSFYDALTDRFFTVYLPEEHISIDESLMLWKGRLAIKQYTASEQVRFGLKLYELCESQSGYLWKSIVHIGPAMQLVDSPDGLRSSQIVLTLAKDLLGKGYCIFMDIWYSSPALLRELHANNTDAVGIARLFRKNMPSDPKQRIHRGETVVRYSSDMVALSGWRERKLLFCQRFMELI